MLDVLVSLKAVLIHAAHNDLFAGTNHVNQVIEQHNLRRLVQAGQSWLGGAGLHGESAGAIVQAWVLLSVPASSLHPLPLPGNIHSGQNFNLLAQVSSKERMHAASKKPWPAEWRGHHSAGTSCTPWGSCIAPPWHAATALRGHFQATPAG